MVAIKPIPPGVRKDGVGYPGVDETGKLYWNIFFYWQKWTHDLRCTSTEKKITSSECGIKISKRC